MANGTFKIIKEPKGVNIVIARWVWTVKYTAQQAIDRYKARLVARGFTQIYGLDFWDTYTPTLRVDSLRLLLSLVAIEDMEADQVDVNNAYTESDLGERIYIRAPKGFEILKGYVLCDG